LIPSTATTNLKRTRPDGIPSFYRLLHLFLTYVVWTDGTVGTVLRVTGFGLDDPKINPLSPFSRGFRG